MFLIGIGANLPGKDGEPPLATARWAAARLDALPGLRLRGLSRWYLTEPVPPSGQAPYVNAIAALAVAPAATAPDPAQLLAWLQAMEASAGRVRGERNAARTLDLDIIAMGEAGAMVRDCAGPGTAAPAYASAGFCPGALARCGARVAAPGAATIRAGSAPGTAGPRNFRVLTGDRCRGTRPIPRDPPFLPDLSRQPPRAAIIVNRRGKHSSVDAPDDGHPGAPETGPRPVVLGAVLHLRRECAVRGDLHRDRHGPRARSPRTDSRTGRR